MIFDAKTGEIAQLLKSTLVGNRGKVWGAIASAGIYCNGAYFKLFADVEPYNFLEVTRCHLLPFFHVVFPRIVYRAGLWFVYSGVHFCECVPYPVLELWVDDLARIEARFWFINFIISSNLLILPIISHSSGPLTHPLTTSMLTLCFSRRILGFSYSFTDMLDDFSVVCVTGIWFGLL